MEDTKILAVKHLPFRKTPQSLQRIENCGKRLATVMTKPSRKIFKQQIARRSDFSQPDSLKEQDPAGISEPFSSASDAECLTRESTAEQVEFGHCFRIGFSGIVNESLSFRIKQHSIDAQDILVTLAVSYTLKSSGPTRGLPETANSGKHINKSNNFAQLLLSFFKFSNQAIIGTLSYHQTKSPCRPCFSLRSAGAGFLFVWIFDLIFEPILALYKNRANRR